MDFELTNPKGETNPWAYGCMLDSHRGHYISANLVQCMPDWVTSEADLRDAERYCDGEIDSELSEHVVEAAQEICERFNQACMDQNVDAYMDFWEGEVMIQPEAWWQEFSY